MTLQEAVNRLRGDEGSNVNVMITRAGQGGWTVPRRFTLTRAVISVDSVESRMLANGVGYARNPQVFMKHGDVVEVEVSRVGILGNPVIESPA